MRLMTHGRRARSPRLLAGAGFSQGALIDAADEVAKAVPLLVAAE
jgi:hypothetical protein